MTTRARPVDPEIWGHALSVARFVPLQQAGCYGAAMRKRGRVVRQILVETDGQFTLGLQAITRRIAGLPLLTTSLRGPFAFADAAMSAPALRAATATLGARWPQLLLLSPHGDDDEAQRAALRGAGCREIMTGGGIALLPLDGDAAELRRRLDQKWRNRLVRAEAAGLTVDIARGGAALDWMLNAHARLMARKRFKGLPGGFVLDLLAASTRRDVQVVVAHRRKETVAGAVFLRHGPTATYLIAATEPDGRTVHAGNLVLWRGLLALQEAGVTTCDLGLVDTERSAALARFKLGTGATPMRLAGTWTPSWF